QNRAGPERPLVLPPREPRAGLADSTRERSGDGRRAVDDRRDVSRAELGGRQPASPTTVKPRTERTTTKHSSAGVVTPRRRKDGSNGDANDSTNQRARARAAQGRRAEGLRTVVR